MREITKILPAVLFIFVLSSVAFAQGTLPRGAIGLADIAAIVAEIVMFLSIVSGVLVTIYIFWAGVTWVSARDDAAKAQKAKDMLKNGIIGAIIIFGVETIALTIEYVLTNRSLY